jgi:hypothetical protein
VNAYRDGINLIRKGAQDAMQDLGLQPIPAEHFDPHFHEAVEAVSGGEEGKVVRVVQQGWHDGDKIFRVAKVIVFQGESKRAKPQTKEVQKPANPKKEIFAKVVKEEEPTPPKKEAFAKVAKEEPVEPEPAKAKKEPAPVAPARRTKKKESPSAQENNSTQQAESAKQAESVKEPGSARQNEHPDQRTHLEDMPITSRRRVKKKQ